LNSGVVIATGTGAWTQDGGLTPVSVKEGDKVLLPEFGGTQIVLGDKE
jgi:chaperonin GroES